MRLVCLVLLAVVAGKLPMPSFIVEFHWILLSLPFFSLIFSIAPAGEWKWANLLLTHIRLAHQNRYGRTGLSPTIHVEALRPVLNAGHETESYHGLTIFNTSKTKSFNEAGREKDHVVGDGLRATVSSERPNKTAENFLRMITIVKWKGEVGGALSEPQSHWPAFSRRGNGLEEKTLCDAALGWWKGESGDWN